MDPILDPIARDGTASSADAVRARVREAEPNPGSGLLFHGTCEAFALPPSGGGYDGLVWTADAPTVAQSYIPASGSSMLLAPPDPWRLGERVVPEPHGSWLPIVRQMGFEPVDLEISRSGTLMSWRLPPGWPSYGEATEYLRGLGYDTDRNVELLLARGRDGAERIMPAGWRMPGRLLVTVADGLDLADLRRGTEGDLQALEYHDHAAFAAARRAGRDGVTINDFAQSRNFGNVGHVSHGLFPEVAARLPWLEVPAGNFDWASMAERTTPAYEALREALAAAAAPAP